MAPSKDSLDVLQDMFKEVLIQTGKALKASQRDGPRSVMSAGSTFGTKMPDAMRTFHYALDDLESEITRAKAVLLRDLEKLQTARMVVIEEPVAPPAPMMEELTQPISLMDMPSSAAHTMSTTANFQPDDDEPKRAPFPDMGMGLSDDIVDLTENDQPLTTSPQLQLGNLSSSSAANASTNMQTPNQATLATANDTATSQSLPTAAMQSPSATQIIQDTSIDDILSPRTTGGAATADMAGGELSFTDIEFSLAPAADGLSQNAPPAPMQDFDLSSFTANDGTTDTSPANLSNVPNPAPLSSAATTTPAKATETTADDTKMDSMYDLTNIGDGNVDNMDLDLSLGDNMGITDSAFDDLFFDTTENADMEQFDDGFFGVD